MILAVWSLSEGTEQELQVGSAWGDAQGAEGLWEGHFSLCIVESRPAAIPGGLRVEGTTWIVSRWLLTVPREGGSVPSSILLTLTHCVTYFP